MRAAREDRMTCLLMVTQLERGSYEIQTQGCVWSQDAQSQGMGSEGE